MLTLSRLERDLVLTAAVARAACGAAEVGEHEGEALSSLLMLAAELAERTAVVLHGTDDRLESCREACLVAAAAARQLAPRQLSNGY